MAILTVITETGKVALPAPVSISVGNEIIWSSNTGRSASGKMLGDVVATKDTLNIEWGILTSEELNTIKNGLKAGFFTLQVNVDGNPVVLDRYRGTLTYQAMGKLEDGIYYFSSVSVDVIQQ